MQPWNTDSADRCPCAERLESRRLLSGAGGDSDSEEVAIARPGLVTVQMVEVVELGPADEEEDEEVTIDPSELPAEVRSALESAYPGAEILEVEVEQEDGEAEYDVAARFEETLLEVGISSEGEIIEVSQLLSQSELPPEVIAWIEANFDEPELLEVELVNEDGVASYELEIAPDDRSAVEVTLRLDQVVVEAGTSPPTPDSFDEAGQTASRETQEPAADLQADAATQSSPPPLQNEQQEPAAEPETVTAPDGQSEPPADLWTPVHGDPGGEKSSQELAEAVAEETIALPGADLLVRARWIDLGSIDNQLQQLLREIDKMAHGLADESSGAGLRLALILAMIAGAQLFRNDALAKRPASAVFMETDRASAWTRWSATTMRA